MVALPAPAAFSVSNLSIKPVEVQPKELVAISVSIVNIGGTEGSSTVVLMINGVKEVEKRVTLPAGITEMWFVYVEREEPGSYSVTVNGLSGSFTVLTPVTPAINWPLAGFIAAVVVVILVIAFVIVRRRAVEVKERE
ncbi:hypothetical protein ES703_86685 [subsurface metagenome]